MLGSGLSLMPDDEQEESFESVFGFILPAKTNANDDAAPDGVNLGTRFKTSVDGNIVGFRYYKGATAISQTRIGRLWTNAGVSLGSAAFTGETSSGWQETKLAVPVAITAGSIYLVSIHHPKGDYANDAFFFGANDYVNGNLIGLKSAAGNLNGVFSYGVEGVMPTNMFNKTAYFSDVLFEKTGP
jgi:Domain of unknown function (DUF4082)